MMPAPSAGPGTSWPTSSPHGPAADTDRPSCRGAAVADRSVMAAQTVSHSTAAAFQQMGVQRRKALEHRDWYEEVPSRIADEPFDFALVVAFARPAEPVLEQVVRLQLGEHARALPLAVTEDAGHR